MGAFSALEMEHLRAASSRARAWTWDDVVSDPFLAKCRFQIELDKFGRLIMSPAANWRHGSMQAAVAALLARTLGAKTAVEVAIETPEGTFEPDVVWAPKAFWAAQNPNRADLPSAPPLVVEVLSPSNSEAEMAMKTQAYLQSGAEEVWLVALDGSVRFFERGGQCDVSARTGLSMQAVRLALAD